MIRVTPVQGPENLRNSDTIIAEQNGGLFDVAQVASACETIFLSDGQIRATAVIYSETWTWRG